MPLGNRVGGVYVDVRLDTSRLEQDFRALQSRMNGLARQSTLTLPAGVSGGGSGPGAPAGGAMGLRSALLPSISVQQQMAGSLRSIQGQHGQLLSRIAASTAKSAANAKFQLNAFNDARRMEVQGRAGAALRGRLNQLFGTRFNTNPRSRFDHLGADIRAAGGGFRFGDPRGGSVDGPLKGLSEAARKLDTAGQALRNAAAMQLRQARAGMARGASSLASGTSKPDPLAPMTGLSGAASQMGRASAASGRRAPTGGTWAATPGGKPRFYKGGQYIPKGAVATGTGSSATAFGFGAGLSGMNRRQALGGVAGGIAGTALGGPLGGLAGAAFGVAPGPILRGAGQLGGGAAKRLGAGSFARAGAIGGAAAAIPGGLGALATGPGGIAAAGASILGFGNTINLAMAPLRSFGNMIRAVEEGAHRLALSPVFRAGRATLAAPFHVALAPLRLFSRNVDESVQKFGALGTVARGLRFGLVTPFRLALSPIAMVAGSMGRLVRLAGLLGPALGAAFVGRGVAAAAQLEMTVGRLETAFGDAASKSRDFAEGLAGRFGLGRQSVMETQAQLGLMLTGAGVEGGQSESLSRALTERAGDMASTFGAPLEEIKSAMQSALAGVFRPLRRFDVLIDAQAVKQRAVAMGLASTTDEVSNQARALATYNLILQRTGIFQGGMQQNMNTSAMLSREIAGRFRNLAEEVGQRLLPAWREMQLLVTDLFTMGSGSGEQSPLMAAIARVGERIRDGIRAVRVFAANWRAVLEVAAEVGRGIGRVFSGLFSWFMEAGQNFFGWFLSNWQNLLTDMGNAFQAFIANFSSNVQELGKAVRDFATGKGWNFEGKGLLDGFQATTGAMPELPGLDLGVGETTGNIRDIFAGMAARAMGLRGVGEEGEGRHHAAADPLGMGAAAEEAGRSGRSMTGSLVSAEQLRDIQNRRDNHDRQIEQNTRKSAEHLAALAGALASGNPLNAAITAVAAP